MKQAKRMLAVFLSMIMITITLTVGVQAYSTNYNTPAGYNDILEPYISDEQAASALLDYIDAALSGVNVTYSGLGMDIDIHSVDSLFNSLKSVVESTTYKAGAAVFSLGKIESINFTIPKDSSIRRTSSTMSDKNVLFKFLEFLKVNADPIYCIVDDTFGLGVISSVGGVYLDKYIPQIKDLHGYITETAYKALIDSEGTGYDSTMKLDAILQSFIEDHLVKMVIDLFKKSDGTNVVADFLGLEVDGTGALTANINIYDFLPSLKTYTTGISITADTTYDFCENIFNALIADVVIPNAGTLASKYLNESYSQYIDIAFEYLKIDMASLGITSESTVKEKIDALLSYLFIGEGKEKYIYFKHEVDENGNETGNSALTINEDFLTQINSILKVVLPMLPKLWKDGPNVTKTADEINAMGDEQLYTYILQIFLDKFVDNVHFAKDCSTIRELATYTLVDVCAELVPDIDYQAQIDSGALDPNGDACLQIAGTVIAYYLNGESPIKVSTSASFEDVLSACMDYLLGDYGSLFSSHYNTSSSSTNVWMKIYDSVFDWIPITVFCGPEDSWFGVQDLVMNDIIGNILDFNFNGLLSIIGRRNDGDLMKPLSQVIVNLLARVINGLFQEPKEKASGTTQTKLVIPYEYTTLDQLITVANADGTGLKQTVYNLLDQLSVLYTGTSCLLVDALPLIVTLMSLWKPSENPYFGKNDTAYLQYGTVTIKGLKELYNECALSNNDNVSYDDDSYQYFHMVDFNPFLYVDFKGALGTVRSLIQQYDASLTEGSEVVAPTVSDMTYAAYLLSSYKAKLNSSNGEYTDEAQTTRRKVASDYQLLKVYNAVNTANYTNTEAADGSKTYTDRTWKAYSKAKAFADKVVAEYNTAAENDELYNYRQSKVNMARRQLIDAVANLKAWVPIADYTAVDTAENRTDLITDLRTYSKESIAKVVAAYKESIALERDYDQDDQTLVDSVASDLNAAIDGLEEGKYLMLLDTSAQHVDSTNNFMYGFNEGFYTGDDAEMTFNDYFLSNYGLAYPDGSLTFEPTAMGSGTGSVVNMYDADNNFVDKYTVVIFGDVDGDSKVDACDSLVMKAYSAMLLSDSQYGSAAKYASDLNYDGYISSTDSKVCENEGLFKTTVDQNPEALTSKPELTISELIASGALS